MRYPICDITYTVEGYVAEPWYAPAAPDLPDKWLGAVHIYVHTDIRPQSPNYLGELPSGGFLIYCDIIDPDYALKLLEEGECPPVTCVPEATRYSLDPKYGQAVDKYNQAVVDFVLEQLRRMRGGTDYDFE